MSNCPHQISFCKLNDCEKCAFVGVEHMCPKSHSSSGEDVSPTFGWVLGMIRESKGVCAQRRNAIRNSITSDIRLVGLDLDCRMSMMTRGKFKLLISLLEARGIERITVRGHLDTFSALCSERYEQQYEAAGYEIPAFSIPKYEVKPKQVQDVPERSISMFRKMMGKWASEGNTQLYIAAWFGLNAGMRWGDVCRIRWSVFERTIDGVFITYVPHKTEKKNSRPVSFRVDSESYLDIEPFIGMPDSYVLVRHDNRAKKGQETHGEGKGLHRSLHNRINAALRECGIGTGRNEKRFHALRKRYDTRNRQIFGEDEAARRSGHTVEVARRSYFGTESGRWS